MENYRTVYDETTRTWYGPTVKQIFNPEASLGQIMLEILSRSPDRVMQLDMDTGRSLTYGEFRTRLIRFAQNLTSAGVCQGDVVTLANTNNENLAPLACALITIGAPFNPLPPGFNENDYAHMMRLTQPKMVFTDADNYETVRKALESVVSNRDAVPPIYVFECTRSDVNHAEDLMKETGREETFRAPYLGDSKTTLAAVLCSSGTSGPQKGVKVTHAAAMLRMSPAHFDPIPKIHFNFSALYWTSGFSIMLKIFYNGAIRLITRKSFNVDQFFEAVEKYRAEAIFLPTVYTTTLMVDPRIKTADLSSLKMWTVGASAAPEQLRDRIDALLAPHGGRSYNLYGSTENSTNALDIIKRKPGAIGPLTPNMLIRVVDEDGNRLGVGEHGELLIKTNAPFVGYYGNEEASKAAIDSDGFFRSGDIGYIDEEGFLYMIDRKKDILKYQNYQVTPFDLETIILRIDGVQEVCVVGIRDAKSANDLPTAVIVREPNVVGAKLDASQVRTIVDGQVSDFKRLRGGVHFISELPKTSNGKVLRRKVTEMIAGMNQATNGVETQS